MYTTPAKITQLQVSKIFILQDKHVAAISLVCV